MKKILLCMLILTGFALSQNMQTYCCAPPYVMQVVKPNILFSLDMTGSMWWRAAYTVNGGQYDPDIDYYGYFYSDTNYYYASSRFWKEGHEPGGALGPFPGNIMNWAIMSRVDILRKVLVGGKGEPSQEWPKHTLEPQGSGRGWPCYINATVNGSSVGYMFEAYTADADWWIRIRQVSPVSGATWVTLDRPIPTNERYHNKIDVPAGDPYGMGGVLRQIADKDNDGNFDEEAPRVAIQYFSAWSENFQIARQFWESDGQQAVSAEAFMNDVNNKMPGGNTPVGKAVFDAACYFSYVDPYYNAFLCEGRGHWKDPYYTGQGYTLQPVWCRKSFVVMLGDGESNSDDPAVNTYALLPDGPFNRPLYDYDADYNSNDTRSHPGDDYAYYAHITDLRPDLEDMQSVTFYSIFCFGEGDALFEEIAKDGGFDDLNNDNVPQPEEYDKNSDGIPDNYYESADGYQLEAAILKIVNEISSQISSGSGVSVVTPGSRTGGMTVQAQFYPRRDFPESGVILEWTGTCQGLWLDPYGWIREDNAADHVLNLQEDYIISMQWDNSEQNVMVTRIQDLAGTGDPSQFDTILPPVEIEAMVPVWDAGEWLWQADPDVRRIMTFIDGDDNGIIAPSEIEDFTGGNSIIYPYLGVTSDDSAEILINYVRGTDYADLRNRTAGGNVWKLGDIISSGAVSVQGAIERYDFIYGDQSYIPYRDLYADRRQVVFAGANDGMLHCFNSGIPTLLQEDPVEPMMLVDNDYELGQELWAYIPYNLLPHLKWLQDPAYCHVYYNDLETYVTDAQIFADDPVHPQGWGTILIGGMRLGGMTIANAVDTCGSALFAIDVTDPDNPVPLWEFSHPDLGLTVCYSCVIKVKDAWYLVFGSGPQTCGGESTQNARIFCIDLLTGALLNTWTVADANSFISNIFGADWGLDYNVDRIYAGSCIADTLLPGGWGGKIYRLLTRNDTDPLNWEFETIFDMQRPVTAEGSIATDQFNHLWVYFGSGRFFSEIDEYDYTEQRYVGFREDTTHAMTISGLFDVSDIVVDTNGVVHYANGATSTFDALVDTVNATAGWWRELGDAANPGERSLTTSLVFGGAVLFTTYIPTEDICAYGGYGNLYALYFRTGTAFTDPFLLSDTLAWRPVYIHLGQGMPSEPSLYVSADQTKVFIQAGGGVVSPETGIPGLPETGVILWKAQ
ncbi:MAG: hypothetical protein JSW02_02745 [candidate division WOR-3 bacterium]|nr:MAG: hypothetical protein JSW02_02745 [candidate division WOR-3 bacterium]